MKSYEPLSTVLVVDDKLENVALLVAVLAADYRIRSANCGESALESIREIRPDLILLDIMMPEMNGYEVCSRIKADPELRDIPVIFLSALESTDFKLEAFASGCVDYITKPFQVAEVRARVKTHLMIRSMQRQLEAQNNLLARVCAERTHLAMIVESSNDAIFSVSLEDTITSWNGGAEQIFGYPAKDIIGKQIYTIIPGEHYIEKSHILQTILRGEQIQHFETSLLRKNSRKIHVSITISPISEPIGTITGYSIIASDVTDRKKKEEIIKYQAFHDDLTDLPNRHLFMNVLSLGMAQSRRYKKKLALLFLDLDGFKQVNDRLGHSCGDHLLQEVARRLKTSIRESDTVARFGGDEFMVLMPDLAQVQDVEIVLRKIMGVFEAPFILAEGSVECRASVGVCMYPADGSNCKDLIKKADRAMYAAKGTGRNSYQFYNAEIKNSLVSSSVSAERVVNKGLQMP